MLVLGIDPGVTTGVVRFDCMTETVEYADDITSPIHLYELLRRLNDDPRLSTVVLEQYVGAGPRTNEALHTIKLVGFVEHLCAAWQLRLIMQSPQQRKHQLSRASAMLPDGPHHAKDALGHVLAFLGYNPIMQDESA